MNLLVSIVMNAILWVYLLAYIAYEFVRWEVMKELRAGLLGAGLMAFGLIVVGAAWLLVVRG